MNRLWHELATLLAWRREARAVHRRLEMYVSPRTA
jgi:hypothetical protein